jgi:hypothetical protein
MDNNNLRLIQVLSALALHGIDNVQSIRPEGGDQMYIYTATDPRDEAQVIEFFLEMKDNKVHRRHRLG